MEKHTIMDGKVHVYKRERSKYWQCSTYLSGKNRRASTKQELLTDAKHFAEDWYYGLIGQHRSGQLKDGHPFMKAAQEFENAVRGVPEIVEVARMMGQPDYLVRVVTSDADHFESLYIDVLANLPHVQKLTSQLAMKIVKRTTELPLKQPGTKP